MSLLCGLRIGMVPACSRPSTARLLPFELIRILHKSRHARCISTWTPTFAPKLEIDLTPLKNNPELYHQVAKYRNYNLEFHPSLIQSLSEELKRCQQDARPLRERNNHLEGLLANATALRDDDSEETRKWKGMPKEQRIEEAKSLKSKISAYVEKESALKYKIQGLAAQIPNLIDEETPLGHTPTVVRLNQHPEPDPSSSDRVWRSHVHIGTELKLLDFAAAATTSGWGWYFLLDEAAQLEQALVQYALSTARKHGFTMVTPPSVVYSHIVNSCGFQPRDQHSESQIYSFQQSPDDVERKPELSLAGTAEIPLAGMKASTTFEQSELPLKFAGVSRCFRAEAGGRGADTKGLYRVHEFTKVEMFAWTLPSRSASTQVFDEMLVIQEEILESLGLHFRVLEMPSTDLGASATRKRDIEAWFPSRRAINDGYGEVTSVSICTDYQSRRLATKVNLRSQRKVSFPYTVNGTALAVPRVLAAILENGWDEEKRLVRIPEVLWPWMNGLEVISRKR